VKSPSLDAVWRAAKTWAASHDCAPCEVALTVREGVDGGPYFVVTVERAVRTSGRKNARTAWLYGEGRDVVGVLQDLDDSLALYEEAGGGWAYRCAEHG
jgi:hypothetical protein